METLGAVFYRQELGGHEHKRVRNCFPLHDQTHEVVTLPLCCHAAKHASSSFNLVTSKGKNCRERNPPALKFGVVPLEFGPVVVGSLQSLKHVGTSIELMQDLRALLTMLLGAVTTVRTFCISPQ